LAKRHFSYLDKTRIVSLPVCREIGYPFRLYLCTASIIRRCAEMHKRQSCR